LNIKGFVGEPSAKLASSPVLVMQLNIQFGRHLIGEVKQLATASHWAAADDLAPFSTASSARVTAL
jgi:hypothetical protein